MKPGLFVNGQFLDPGSRFMTAKSMRILADSSHKTGFRSPVRSISTFVDFGNEEVQTSSGVLIRNKRNVIIWLDLNPLF
jgi:hypothetical protein